MKYQPMLAKDSKEFKVGPEWLVERKWDGMRAIFEIGEDSTQIWSRTGQDLNPQFPELVKLHEVLPQSVLDGEIVYIGPDGIEDLEGLQMRANDKQARRMEEFPVTVRFFDVLEVGPPNYEETTDIRHMELWRRRQILEYLVGPKFMVQALYVETVEEIPPEWEGVISKLVNSPYESGKRRRSWSKYKFTNRATLKVVALTPGKGARKDSFGALVVEDAKGVPRGQVGSGFPAEVIAEIMDLWYAYPEKQFPLIEVEYRFMSKTGLMVNTAFKGLRYDKTKADDLGS